jgi:hypothetical protein
MTSTYAVGSGTYSSWTVLLTGIQGSTGVTGPTGPTGATPTAPLTLTQAANNANYPLTISSANQQGGGAGYSDIIKMTNSKSGATNINKHLRLKDDGNLEIINSAYTAALLTLSDAGAFSVPGPISQTNYNVGDVVKATIWSASDMGFNSDATISSSASYTTVASKSYTPGSSSSYIFFEVYARYEIAGAAADSFFSQLTWNGIEIGIQRQVFANGSGGGTRSSTLFPLTGRVTNSGGTFTLAVNVRRDSADDNVVVKSDSAFYVKVTEIAR